jgi:hypothetical protein
LVLAAPFVITCIDTVAQVFSARVPVVAWKLRW